MRRKVRLRLLAEFAKLATDAGFSRLDPSRDPFHPAGLALARERAADRWEFVAITAKEDGEAFQVRVAWATASEYPKEPRDLAIPLSAYLDGPAGEFPLGEVCGTDRYWWYLDRNEDERQRQLESWRIGFVKEQLAGGQGTPPPIVPPSPPCTVDEAIAEIPLQLLDCQRTLVERALPLLLEHSSVNRRVGA